MHIPDRFLSPEICVTTGVAAAAFTGYAVRRTSSSLPPERAPVLGVMAALVFGAQTFNYPVGPGTSGHLLGAVLAAIVLGPWAATVVMATVFVVQCLLFQDGGVTALGANMLNMGVVGAVGGYGLWKLLTRLARGERGALGAAFVASWLSVLVGAALAAVEMGASGVMPMKVVLTAMLSVHAVIGLGEGLITVAALAAMRRACASLLPPEFLPPPAYADATPVSAGARSG